MRCEHETDDHIAQDAFRIVLDKMIEERISRAVGIYDSMAKALWIGNAGASIATLSFIGATWRAGGFYAALIWPLLCFVLGLVAMGAGSTLELWHTRLKLLRMTKAGDVLDLPVGDADHPTDLARLTLRDPRTALGITSGLLFVLGCLVGLAELWFAS